jgi:hypothetical protein
MPDIGRTFKKIDANTIEVTTKTTWHKQEFIDKKNALIAKRDTDIAETNGQYNPQIAEVDAELEKFA